MSEFLKHSPPILLDVRLACQMLWQGDAPDFDIRVVCNLLGASPLTVGGQQVAALALSKNESGRYVLIYPSGLIVTRRCVSILEANAALRECARGLIETPPLGIASANVLAMHELRDETLVAGDVQMLSATAECYIGPIDLKKLAVYTAVAYEAKNDHTRHLYSMKAITGNLALYFHDPNVMVLVSKVGRVIIQVQGGLPPGWSVSDALTDASERCLRLVGAMTL